MPLTPDAIIFWRAGPVVINATLVATWIVMAVLVVGSAFVTRRLRTDATIPRWQGVLETIVTTLVRQIGEAGVRGARGYLPFVGTLFLFIAGSAVLTLVPGFTAPTASLSTTATLALAVFVAVPVYGIRVRGLRAYLASYLEPSPILLPFNVISELSRTLSLAVRLFGNMMSGAMVIGILLAITPFLFPAVMTAFGLLTGFVQAYIFAILATVFIAAATRGSDVSDTAAVVGDAEPPSPTPSSPPPSP